MSKDHRLRRAMRMVTTKLRRGRPLFRAAAVLLAASPTVAAQERRPLLGRVTGPNGAPVAGATVQLALVPLGHEAEPAVEHPTATTDANGRFRVDLRPWLSYRAWAIGPLQPDGSYLASKVENVWAGPLWELQANAPLRPARFSLLEAPPRRAASLRVLPDEVELPGWTFALDDTGTTPPIALPQAPPLAWLEHVEAGQVRDTNWALPIGSGFAVHPTPELPMLAVDHVGAPVADVEILQRAGMQNPRVASDTMGLASPNRVTWHSLGTTDADGKLLARIRALPLAKPEDLFDHTNWFGVVFQARKPGFATTVITPFTGRARDRSQPLQTLRIELAAAEPLRGRIVPGIATDAPVTLTVRAEIEVMEWWRAPAAGSLVWHTQPTADGRFAIADLPTATRRLQAWIDTGRGAPVALHPLHLWATQQEQDCTINLDTLRQAELRLCDAHRAPLASAQALLLSLQDDAPVDAWTTRLVPDSAGRIQVRLQPGPWLLFARDDERFATAILDAARPETVEVMLCPLASMRGRVVDSDGKPIAGCAVRHDRWVRHAAPPDGGHLWRVAKVLEPLWLHRAITDQDGWFTCRFLAQPDVTNWAYVLVGNRRTAPFPLLPDAEPSTFIAR